MPCSNAAKMRNQLKFAGVPQTGQPISAASRPKFTILWGCMWRRYCCLTSFFSDCRYVSYLRRNSPTKLWDGAQMAIFGEFLGPAFPASRVQHISDLHSKFALRPHHVWKYGRHPTAEIKRWNKKKKKKKIEETKGQKYNVRICYAGRP